MALELAQSKLDHVPSRKPFRIDVGFWFVPAGFVAFLKLAPKSFDPIFELGRNSHHRAFFVFASVSSLCLRHRFSLVFVVSLSLTIELEQSRITLTILID